MELLDVLAELSYVFENYCNIEANFHLMPSEVLALRCSSRLTHLPYFTTMLSYCSSFLTFSFETIGSHQTQ